MIAAAETADYLPCSRCDKVDDVVAMMRIQIPGRDEGFVIMCDECLAGMLVAIARKKQQATLAEITELICLAGNWD